MIAAYPDINNQGCDLLLAGAVQKHPVVGISPHLHLCIVRRARITIEANDRDVYTPGGTKIEFRMPPVARSWDEFKQLSQARNVEAASAIC